MSSCRSALLGCLLWVATGVAADDLVVLTNGNRMNGTVREMARGQLDFSIAGAGRVSIDWRNVAQLETDQRLDVESASGERFLGTIAAPAAGTLEIMTDVGRREIALSDVVRMTPVATTFRDRTKGSIDAGLDFLSAADEVDWTLNAEVRNRREQYLTEISFNSLVRRHDHNTTQQRNDLQLGVRRLLHERWFALGLFEAQEDRELDLDLRVLAGVALGRTIVQSSRTAFAIYGGFDFVHEEYRGPSSLDEDLVEALAALEWDWFDLGEFTLSIEATTYVALENGRLRFELDGRLRRYITSAVYLSLNAFQSYNDDPPEEFENSDWGLSLTFGRTF